MTKLMTAAAVLLTLVTPSVAQLSSQEVVYNAVNIHVFSTKCGEYVSPRVLSMIEDQIKSASADDVIYAYNRVYRVTNGFSPQWMPLYCRNLMTSSAFVGALSQLEGLAR